MRRTAAALLTALLAVLGAIALPATARADAPGNCTTHHEGPAAFASCTEVPEGTMWQAQVACFYLIGDQPVTYWATGNVVTGNGTSSALCGYPHSWATKTIRPVVVGVAGRQGRLVGYGDKCVDVRHGRAKLANAVQIHDCNGTAAQWWTLGVDHSVRALGMCLNVVWGRSENGTKVEIYDCVGSPGEQWIPQDDGSLKNVLTGKCLDDLGFSTDNDTQLGIWDCNGLPNQKWVLTP
ncbi:RICIN domain-containing protein [Streptomyces orinoci]|uniref:RICIN domain-containing protein n=1 Tax=Streptomyces orinoci TaxID=67339 RepID=A0ABV3JSZ5_STRON|nr:RICIN domain-containing protein [Streptomyces orinoci]